MITDRRGLAPAALPLLALVLATWAPNLANARPIRTNTPGTGIFIGTGLLGQLVCERQSRPGVELTGCEWVADFRYTPATHWVLGVRIPYVIERSLGGVGATRDADGLGDLELVAKHRFYRKVGKWSDRHAAVEVGLSLPTGDSTPLFDSGLPPALWARLQPGIGSTDVWVDLIYQQGRRRFVFGGDLSYRRNGEGDSNYRFGDQLRLDLDAEYIAFPRKYTTPGHEVFVLLEASVVHRAADQLGNRALSTGGTEILLAPGIQYIATEQFLLSASLQFGVLSDLGPAALQSDWNVLIEFRFAF